MMRKLRIFLAALLLVPALFSNASAFTTQNDSGFDPARPKAGMCWIYAGGAWWYYPC
jgi:hypothetical protein